MAEFGEERSTQAAVAAAEHSCVRPAQQPLPAGQWRTWLVAIPLAIIVIYAFMPVLDNGFVPSVDDDENFLANPHFRGLGAAQVKWALTTFWVGAYQPLGWLLFETQYVFCQLKPRGYHLTSLLLQVASAVVLYVLTMAMLVRCRPESGLESPWTSSLSAGLATTLFVVHPLRVEAVAWISCQPYLPCALFSMLAVLAYLRAFPRDSSPRRGWLAGSFFLFVTALLFKAVPVTLPVVLLILDFYPLRRIPDESDRWFGACARRALLEKVPFFMVSLVFMGLAIAAKPQSRVPFQQYGPSEAIARACHGTWFYVQKTVLPWDLVALYEAPAELNWLEPRFGLSILATLATSAGLFLLRRRCAALLAAWMSYLVILAPSSGIVRMNNHLEGDRYSYMAMLGLVTLVAAGFCRIRQTLARGHAGAIAIIALSLGAVLSLTAMTRSQCRTWFNEETLWTHALTHGAGTSFVAHNSLGNVFLTKKKYEAAAAYFTEALRLNPDYEKAHYNLGNVLYMQGKYEGATAHYTEALRINPGYAKAHYNLGIVLDTLGNYQAAKTHYIDAVRLNPRYVEAHYQLGKILDRLGKHKAAAVQFAEAIELVPDFAEAYNAIAMIMAACPDATFRDGKRAAQFATRACELTKWNNPHILGTLAAAQAEDGDFTAAVLSQKRGLELLRGERERDAYRSRLALYQAKKPYRQESSQLASGKSGS